MRDFHRGNLKNCLVAKEGKIGPKFKKGSPVGKKLLRLFTMPTYKCFKCGKKINSTALEKRFVCPGCGSKIFFKPRTKVKKVKAE